MRIADIYAMDARRTSPWHDDIGSTQRLFGYHGMTGEFDVTSAETAKADDLAFVTKLDRYVGQDASLSFVVAELRGRPFALVVSAGEDGQRALVTETTLHAEARAYVEAYREFGKPETVNPDDDLPELDALYGHTVMPLRGKLQFVPDWHLSSEGRPILDHVAYNEGFDRLVRPAFGTSCNQQGDEFKEGLNGERMRALAAEAMLAGLGEGLGGTTWFKAPENPGSDATAGLDWIGVVATDGERTYGIGLPGHAPRGWFTWANHVRPCVLGPASLYETLTVPAE